MIQWMLAIWSLVPLPFLNPVWTSGSSWFTWCWSLAGTVLSVTLLLWKSENEVAQSCPTLCDPMGYNLPDSSVHGIFQARYWSGLPFLSPGDLPDPEIEPGSTTLLVQFSHSVVSDSLQPREPQHARPPCPSPTAGVYPNPCLLSQWCHPTISSSLTLFSSCPQSSPGTGSIQMSQLFASGGQSIGVSALASVLPVNTQDWSPLG